jgi:hypothetical protein
MAALSALRAPPSSVRGVFDGEVRGPSALAMWYLFPHVHLDIQPDLGPGSAGPVRVCPRGMRYLEQ